MSEGIILTFTDLTVWQKNHSLVVGLFNILSNLPKHNSLRNQMERSAVSITSNIAEGFGRQAINDKKHFYVMARGSSFELQNQLLIARDIKLISVAEFDLLSSKSLDGVRLLHGLIRSLDSK